MTRQLRTRASRPNYAALLGMSTQDETGAGPSGTTAEELDDNSGSDFAAEADAVELAEDDDDMDPDDAASEYEEESLIKKRKRSAASTRENSVLNYGSASAVYRARKTPAKATPRRSVAILPGISMSTSRSTHALPSSHHRHRAIGVYKKGGKIERLAEPPKLFGPETTTVTNAWASDELISSRVNKSWGYNVGPGPLWELAEDRGWFKEAHSTPKITERELRPRVHEGVAVTSYHVISFSDATAYLPTDVGATEEGTLKPSPPVACSFGQYGRQIRREVKMFEALRMSEFFPEKEAHVFNAGAPVWGLDWCPIHPDDRPHHRYKQYLAVAPFPSKTYAPMIGTRVQRPRPASIQIWSLCPAQDQMDHMNVDDSVTQGGDLAVAERAGEMQCEMVLCINSGPAFELKWCPLPSNDPVRGTGDRTQTQRKLGIIGGTFEDGSLSFFAVPDPSTTQCATEHSANQPIIVKLSEPLLRIELEETSCWSFDWANSEIVAIGCTNGSIAVYNVGDAFAGKAAGDNQPLFPTHYFMAHQSAIRSLAWIRAPAISASGELTSDNPTVIASGGYDGVECVTDIRDISPNVINRTRDVVTAMEFSTYTGSAVTIDHENMIKAYSLSPSMLGRGHTILEPNGPIWPFLEHKIYQLDYSRSTGEYRMLENLLPQVRLIVYVETICNACSFLVQETQNRTNATRQNKSVPGGTGAWPPEVGVHRVAWNDRNGLARTPLLASATGSGLCRVDWLMGRWVKEPLPYTGIEGIRGEMAGTFVEDDDGDSD
ncbi:hypothetical protein BN946_scf185014.g141 [Trametes cinnabarina]|uniref:Uncharacterized protein n=1 Tax=Pycnoporus cinnabarinus TaxID=5643 RepID=A0A060SHJ7_PYCCI|nr:hypothetical protein BN946_scf185014.g141 [Trametes cinnabarina]